MNNNAKIMVSVDMITYNHEKYIAQAIEGVLMQKTNFLIELVIGEDCSTDNTRQICIDYKEKFPDKIRLLLPNNNLGINENGLQTLKACTGKYIALCEGDDYWTDPYKLQKQVDFLEAHLDYGMIHTNCDDLLMNSGVIIHNQNNQNVREGWIMKEIFSGEVKIKTATVCFRRAIYEQFFPTNYWDLNIPIGDWPLWLVLAKNSKIGYLSDTTAIYRSGQYSYVNVKFHDFNKIEERYFNEKRMYEFMCNLYPEDLIYDEKGYEIFRINSLLNSAIKKQDFYYANKYSNILKSMKVVNFKSMMCYNKFTYNLLLMYIKLRYFAKIVIKGQKF